MQPKQQHEEYKRGVFRNVIVICQHCERSYTVGVNGTVTGCDECEGIQRNFVGQIIDDEDALTDMEKA